MKQKLDLTRIEATKDGMSVRFDFENGFDFTGWQFTMLATIKFLGVAIENALEENEAPRKEDEVPKELPKKRGRPSKG